MTEPTAPKISASHETVWTTPGSVASGGPPIARHGQAAARPVPATEDERDTLRRLRRRRRTAIDAAVIFVIVLLMVQMWLLTATLESYLAGHHEAALPGVVASALLFALTAAIYWFVIRLDRVALPPEPKRASGPWDIS